MMPVEQMPQLIEALASIAEILGRLGVPGLVALVLAGPAAVLIMILVLDHLRTRHSDIRDARHRADMERMFYEYRKDMDARNSETLALVEQHRADTQAILRDLGEKHAQVTQYYRDNVEVVKGYQRMTTDFCDVVVNNTRALERIANMSEVNMFCPMAREAATGRK
ncbi:hypothetical protein [Bilophila wadsworthia]|jgi:hypothetical protein|uniref:hypothetical protein n=1 Tax=Bilophila wadsworthia TaxID=35833 RepID=UPI000495A2DD|nr:hypothetical protein [Bilophila wadsworthia]